MKTPVDSGEKIPYCPSITRKVPELFGDYPNIKSWLTAANGYFFAGNATGAFSSAGYMSKKTANNYAENSSVDSGYGGFNLNAETFNPLYGNSSTVQPAGLYGLYLVRAYQA